jgi:hypothetical protein
VRTAISIPDAIFDDAERLAKRRGWSRSELYAHAVADFVKAERFLGVRERLDTVYGKDCEVSRLDPLLQRWQLQSLVWEIW